jgi:hypothetical protein
MWRSRRHVGRYEFSVLVTAGIEIGVLKLAYHEFSDFEREAVVKAHPRPDHFDEGIIRAFYDGIRHKPDTTFGPDTTFCSAEADVIADKEQHFHRGDFCDAIRGSAWRG